MAKRKRGRAERHSATKTSEYEDANASKLQFNSHEDLLDSEDEFLRNREKILLDNKPEAKRQKQRQEEEEQEFLAPPDEDALAQSSSASEDDDDDISSVEDRSDVRPVTTDRVPWPVKLQDLEDERGGENDDKMIDDWGASASAYYDANHIETEQDALDEEAEARRIQQKRLRALQESDFGFDEVAWAGQEEEEEEEEDRDLHVEDATGTIVTEKLPLLQITSDMTNDEKTVLLQKHYPDFEPFAEDLVDLRPRWEKFNATVKQAGQDAPSIMVAQLRALSAYLGSLAMYFTILVSPGQQTDKMNGNTPTLPFSPIDLRDHEVMQDVERCRRVWNKVKEIGVFEEVSEQARDDEASGADSAGDLRDGENIDTEKLNELKHDKNAQVQAVSRTEDQAAVASRARRTARLRKAEATLADLDAELKSSPKLKPKRRSVINMYGDQENSDVGDEPPLPEHEAAEKARRKKSLRFYTSQIAQKEKKRSNATSRGNTLQGDEDLPHQERIKDRTAQLKRDRRIREEGFRSGEEMEQDEHRDDSSAVHPQRLAMLNGGGQNDYAARLLHHVQSKKDMKRAREAAYTEAREQGGRVVSKSSADARQNDSAGGRREIGFTIEKNKGLTPKRKKENNPRVRKRKRFEDKSKKLKSMKPTWQGGEGRGGYRGEFTGIKKNLVKSVKL